MNFGVDFSKNRLSVEVAGKPEPIHIPSHLKVSCQKEGACTSPSKRKRGFVCGSDFSHDDRMQSCAEYCRLCRGVGHGERGGHPI
jgi:hypothetical protein